MGFFALLVFVAFLVDRPEALVGRLDLSVVLGAERVACRFRRFREQRYFGGVIFGPREELLQELFGK